MSDSSSANDTRETRADDGDGLVVVLSGPSGVGKTTIGRAILDRFGGTFSVSATTRPQSASEVNGKDYYFVSHDEFQAMRQRNEFLECANVFGTDWYGTPRRPVEQQLGLGRIVLLDIDVQGALQVRRAMARAFMLFIEPPGDAELLRRLRTRGRDDEAAIQRRFAEAKHETDLARSSGAYDAILVNDDLEQTLAEVFRLVEAARSRAANGASRS